MTIKWEGTLSVGLDQIDNHIRRGMVAAANYTAPRAEAFMKAEAPWTDRTGNARNGLGAQVVVEGDRVSIVLFHSMPYGVWLELRWGGKYGIIQPTLATAGSMWAEAIKRLVFD